MQAASSTAALPVLEVRDLSKRFGGLLALSDVNLNIHQGEVVALIGPNGAGKTTLFNCITSIYTPSEGQVVLRKAPRGRMQPEYPQTP